MAVRGNGNRLKAAARRVQICETAARIIGRKGYERTSMKDIAREIKVTAPSLYYHVRGKPHLLFLVMNYGAELIRQQVVEPVSRVRDPEEKIRLLIANHIRLMVGKSREVFAIVYEEDSLVGDHYQAKIQKAKKDYLNFVREILAELGKGTKARLIDPTAAGFALLGMINWMYKWYKPGGRLSVEELTDAFTRLFLHGYLGAEA